MRRKFLNDSCLNALTELDLFDQLVATDRALEFNNSPFTGGIAYGYDLSDYAAPMLLPRVVKNFTAENGQTIKNVELRPTPDDKRLGKLSLGLSSDTTITIENQDKSEELQVVHVNKVGREKVIGAITNAELGRFISGLSMTPEVRKKFALMDQNPNGPFAQIITSPDFWLLTAAAIQDQADYTILERLYGLEIEETDPDTFLATTYSGTFFTQQRPDSLLYSLALRGERENYEKITVADMQASVKINAHSVPGQKKIITNTGGTINSIILGEGSTTTANCKKSVVLNLIIEFLRKSTPLMPQLDLVFQRGLPDVPDEAPGVDEL